MAHWIGLTPFDGVVWAFLSHANEAFTLVATTSYNPWAILTLSNGPFFKRNRKAWRRVGGRRKERGGLWGREILLDEYRFTLKVWSENRNVCWLPLPWKSNCYWEINSLMPNPSVHSTKNKPLPCGMAGHQEEMWEEVCFFLRYPFNMDFLQMTKNSSYIVAWLLISVEETLVQLDEKGRAKVLLC